MVYSSTFSFLSCSSLDKDFQELKSKFGYDYIELQLDFSMDLYPFFPPLVKVIRPRLQVPTAWLPMF
jgi:baculoviral IAP repeat-containing protein 6